jgi:hypothetical protein
MTAPKGDPARWNSEVDAAAIAEAFDKREELDQDDLDYLEEIDREEIPA